MRRVATVIVSMLASVALAAGYVVADGNDWVDGALTFAAVDGTTFADARTVRAGTPLVAPADRDKAIDAAAAAKLVDRLCADKAVGKDVSVAVMQADGTVVSSHQPDTAREPASTMKTLTSLAAASVLDMGSTLETRTLLATGSDGSSTVILSGEGDMLLGAGASDAAHVNGRAGLATLAQDTAQALRKQGVTKVTVDYDDSLFGDERYPARISENNGDQLYYTGVSSMAIDGGRQRVRPLDDPDTFEDYPQLSQTTAQDTAATFRTLLAAQGITVQAAAPEQVAVPEHRTALASVSSAPLSAVMAFMLQHSDNTLAELFGRLLALHEGVANSPQGATQAVLAQLDKLGVDTDGVTMADCSGLSPGSRLTVSTLAQVQQRNLEIGIAPAAAEGLSMAGLVGTAATRLADADASGLLRVKTGSLGTVTSMAGNVSREGGGVAAFAVIVNNPSDMAGARTAVNRFVAALARL
ncbi:D-alanyl-D-alanine carboxypeptidase [Bifidobacterium cuniculi]|uniref:D-alanyl-D-alanine carboxypeptidase n=2 Tax=Bifidobacterium cuniculi TaxID=1688 RepID=A0A087AKL7_9BIFI|nr:D-alanyl-D-alanine carboxypeptidase [Bifidobacterium cuniculi]